LRSAKKQDKEAKAEVEVVYSQENGNVALDNAYRLLAKFLLENEKQGKNTEGEVAGA
jgi:intergrase/recombinase